MGQPLIPCGVMPKAFAADGSSDLVQHSVAPPQTDTGLSMSHSFAHDHLWVKVKHAGSIKMLEMKEFSLLKTNKISFLSANKSIIERVPRFRTFKAVGCSQRE